MTRGGCWLDVEGEAATYLRAGDIALIPHGRGHWLRSQSDAPPTGRVDELPQLLVNEHFSLLTCGGDGPRSTLICGVVSFDQPAVGRLVELLPAIMHVEGTDEDESGIRDATRMVTAELRRLRPGGEAVTPRRQRSPPSSATTPRRPSAGRSPG